MDGIDKLVDLPVNLEYKKGNQSLEYVFSIYTDEMEICKPKKIRKRIWCGLREKIYVAHLRKNGHCDWWDIK